MKNPNQGFVTTHWSEISDARSDDDVRRQAALGKVLLRYWTPVYCYLRCKGCTKQAAEDLTQDFFQTVVLGRRLIEQADRSKGRFRTLLLRVLDRYAEDVHRMRKAKRRMPQGGLVRLEEIEKSRLPEPVYHHTPAEAFDYAWASTLLDQSLAELEEECCSTGKTLHWCLFRDRFLQPIMDDIPSPSRTFLCQKYRVPSTTIVSNMVVTVKRRLKAILREQMRRFVGSDAQVDDEIRHLTEVLCEPGARP